MKKNNNSEGRPVEAGTVHLASWLAKAGDTLARMAALDALWVADMTWIPAWRAVVAAAERLTRAWPGIIAERVGAMSRVHAWHLMAAEGPHPPACPPAEGCAAAVALWRELLSHAELGSWPEAVPVELGAARGLSRWLVHREALHLGVELRGGVWIRPAPERRAWMEPAMAAAVRALDQAEADARAEPPMIDPLLHAFADALAAGPEMAALEEALAPPPAPRPPGRPRTSAAARRQWLDARTHYTLRRLAIRAGGYRRRAAVLEAIGTAQIEFRVSWMGWHGAVLSAAGDPPAARHAAERLRGETLEHLARLAGSARGNGHRPQGEA